MEVWVMVGLWDGVLDTCWVFDNLYEVEQAFKDHTGVSHDDYNKAWDESKAQGIDYQAHPLMADWDRHIDAWIVNTTIE